MYGNNCKSENNNLRFTEWLNLLLEKGFVRNRFGLIFYYDIYTEILEEEE